MITVTSHRDRRVHAPGRWRTVGYRAGKGGPDVSGPAVPGSGVVVPPQVAPAAGQTLPRAGQAAGTAAQRFAQDQVNQALGKIFGDLGTQLARLIPAGEVALGAGIALTGLLLVLSQTGPGRVAASGVKMGARVAITRRVAR